MSMIDPRAIPVPVLVKSFLKAMAQNEAEAFVAFRKGTNGGYASNRVSAEAMARQLLTIQEGAIEVAAVALHAFRFVRPGQADQPAPAIDPIVDFCSLHVCAIHEQEAGAFIPWDKLVDEVKDAHRKLAGALIAAAVAHNLPAESSIIQPA